jgi:hypothetical protein
MADLSPSMDLICAAEKEGLEREVDALPLHPMTTAAARTSAVTHRLKRIIEILTLMNI